MKKILRNTTARKSEKKIDYFEIVRNTPDSDRNKSITMGEFWEQLRKEQLNKMTDEEKKKE